jgi:hypothetical protein
MPRVPYDSQEAKFSVDIWQTEQSEAVAVAYDNLPEARAAFETYVHAGTAYWIELNQWTGEEFNDGWKLLQEWPGDDADDEDDDF